MIGTQENYIRTRLWRWRERGEGGEESVSRWALSVSASPLLRQRRERERERGEGGKIQSSGHREVVVGTGARRTGNLILPYPGLLSPCDWLSLFLSPSLFLPLLFSLPPSSHTTRILHFTLLPCSLPFSSLPLSLSFSLPSYLYTISLSPPFSLLSSLPSSVFFTLSLSSLYPIFLFLHSLSFSSSLSIFPFISLPLSLSVSISLSLLRSVFGFN